VFSNIGGTATGIGDPPNILIISNNQIQTSGHVGFSTFTLHMAPGSASLWPFSAPLKQLAPYPIWLGVVDIQGRS